MKLNNKFIWFFVNIIIKGGIILSDEHPRMKFFIRNLENRQWRVREESAEALGEIGDKLAVEPLIKCLKDDDWHVREAAALSLGILDDSQANGPLLNMLNDEKDSVRYGAALALSSVGDETALAPLKLATKG